MKILDLGLTDYRKAYEIQKDLVEKRKKNLISDTLVILEHPPVITSGRAGKEKNILDNKGKMEIINTDRGGDVTYHYPGQVIGYPIIDLKKRDRDVHRYLRNLEEVIIYFLKLYNINAIRKNGYTGVWVDSKKIASIGIGIKQWITYHGFALNIDSDLFGFNSIIPCGIPDVEMTSLEKLLGKKVDKPEVKGSIINSFLEVFKAEYHE